MRAGGATNHRANLSDWVMFKDNHLEVLGIAEAVAAAKVAWPGRLVHVEAGDLDELRQALEAGADAVLLDNMSPEEAKAAVDLADEWAAEHGHRPLLECSGGITIETAAAYAATGVDLLSTSQITQSAPALDIGLDISQARSGRRGAVGLLLLALDVGNTQTVVGLYDLEPAAEANLERRLADRA